MIVVEGPDGTGKTTLIKKLHVEFDLPIAPRVVSKDAEAMVDLKRWTEQNVTLGFQHEIFDRHRLISEPIYGAVLRKSFEPGFDRPQWLTLMYDQFYNKVRPILIYCLPKFETVKHNVGVGDDNKRVRDSIRKIYALYTAKAAADRALCNAAIYDYENPGNLRLILRDIELALVSGVGHHR